MTPPPALLLTADAADLRDAARVLATGGLVAFPTETVYGLGADARDDRAVARVFAAKGRPAFNPLIVHLADVAAARAICVLDARAERLAAAFWPGPMTLVLPLRPDAGISALVTAGLATVAVRVPAHHVAQALLRAFGGPVAAPSANPSGRVSPTTAAHVMAGLGDRIDAVVDGGACDVGIESTIIGLDGPAQLLRAGGLPVEAVEACLGAPLQISADPARPSAPGQLASHYAPRGVLRLNAEAPVAGEVWLGFGPLSGPVSGPESGAISGPIAPDLNLSPDGDLTEAAANLFGYLHRLDAMAAARIAVSPIPDVGLGRAINDRLRRAAAPRHDHPGIAEKARRDTP